MVIAWALCLAGSAIAQPTLPTQPLTMTVRATTVDKVLAKVADATGAKLEVREPLSREVAVFRVKNVPADDLLKRLAKVLLARWEEDAGVWRLVRDEKAEKEEEAILAQRQLSYAERVLKEVRAKLAKAPAWSLREAQSVAEAAHAWLKEANPNVNARMDSAKPIAARTPGTRATLEAVSLLTAEQLAAVFDGRVVFASSPTAAQKRIPNGVLKIVDRWVREQNEWAAAVETRLEPATDEKTARSRGWRPSDSCYYEEMEPFTHVLPVNVRLGKTLLALEKSGGTLVARLLVADENGDFVMFGLCRIADPAAEKRAADKDDRPIPFTDDSRAHAKALVHSAGLQITPTPELLNRIMHPEVEDPLSFSMTDAVLGWAKQPDANVVACLPDWIFDQTAMLAAQKEATYAEWTSMNRTSVGVVVTEAGGFLTAKPYYPLTTRSWRSDRPAMGRFVRKIVGEGRFSLADLLAFKGSNLEMNRFGLGDSVVSKFEPNTYQRIWRNNETALKALAGLPAPQLNALTAGRTLPASSLPAAVREILIKHFLREDRLLMDTGRDGLDWFDDDREGNVEATIRRMEQRLKSGRSPQSYTSIRYDGGCLEEEATEIFASGLPAGTTVSLEIKRQESLLATHKTSLPGFQDLSVDSLSTTMAAKKALGDKAADPPDLFIPGWKSPIYLHVHFSPAWDETLSLYEDTFCSKTQPVPFKSLPADLLKRLKAMIEEKAKLNWIESPKQSGGDGGTIKP